MKKFIKDYQILIGIIIGSLIIAFTYAWVEGAFIQSLEY